MEPMVPRQVAAVKTYQRKHKLTVNGVADYKTTIKDDRRINHGKFGKSAV